MTAIKAAIDAGFRHFDTAFFYGNEREVGQAIRGKITDGAMTRNDVFVVTKVWGIHHKRIEVACRNSLAKLNLEYIDLYLIHWPITYNYHNEHDTMPHKSNGQYDLVDLDYLEIWRDMEQLVELGLVKSIGVSNFNSEQIDRLSKNCKIQPVCNQIECSPGFCPRKLIDFCKERNIVVTGYSPLGHYLSSSHDRNFLNDKRVKEIASKHRKSTAQVALRFSVSRFNN